jgi:sensor c-di-GMP phosphodiesterase-like protein
MPSAAESGTQLGAASPRRRYLLLILLIGLLPFAVLAVVAYYQSQVENQREIDAALDIVTRRVSEILHSVERILANAAQGTGGKCSEEAVALLRRNAYLYAPIREMGIIRDHHLACTSWGMVNPPLALSKEDESSLSQGLALYALDEPALGIVATSLTLAFRSGNGSQINALLYPQTIYRVLDGFAIAEVNVGIVLNGERLLAARYVGSYREFPAGSRVQALFRSGGYLRTSRRIPGYPLTIVADLPEVLKYKHLIPQYTLYLCGAIFVALAGMELVRRLFLRLDSLPFQLKGALTQRQFRLHYQPVVDMESRRCLGMEALLRWEHPTYGLLPPATFVPLAERASIIVAITEWILEEVIQQLEGPLARWPDLYVSINLCQEHLVNDGFAEAAVRRIGNSGIQPEQVHFELTERTLTPNDAGAAATIARFRQAGLRIAVDDFGTGYSTLQSLQAIQVDCIKVDKAFVEAIGTCAVTEHLIDSIIDLAKKLHVEIVAEGVERAEQARYLVQRGVRMGQGFLFGKPVPLAALLEQIAKDRPSRETETVAPAQ